MLVKELIALATSGELKSVAVRNDMDSVVGFINLALIELYKRFPLETDEYLIELLDETTEYVVPDDFMYMIAAFQEIPVTSDIIDNRIPINDSHNPLSVNMVSWNKVQVPLSIDGAFISIIYASSPTLIIYDDNDATYLDGTLPLPPQLIEAMLHYMGYRAHGSITSELKAEDNTHYQRFEASCKRAQTLGLVTAESLVSHYKFGSRGFA